MPCRDGLNRDFNAVTGPKHDVRAPGNTRLTIPPQHLHEFRAHQVIKPNILDRLRQSQKVPQPGIGIADGPVRPRREKPHRCVFNIQSAHIRCVGDLLRAGDPAKSPQDPVGAQGRDAGLKLHRQGLMSQCHWRQRLTARLAGLCGFGQTENRRRQSGDSPENPVHRNRAGPITLSNQGHLRQLSIDRIGHQRRAPLIGNQNSLIHRFDP